MKPEKEIKILRKEQEVDKWYTFGLIFLIPLVYIVALFFVNWWAVNIGILIVGYLFYKTRKKMKELRKLKG